MRRARIYCAPILRAPNHRERAKRYVRRSRWLTLRYPYAVQAGGAADMGFDHQRAAFPSRQLTAAARSISGKNGGVIAARTRGDDNPVHPAGVAAQ